MRSCGNRRNKFFFALYIIALNLFTRFKICAGRMFFRVAAECGFLKRFSVLDKASTIEIQKTILKKCFRLFVAAKTCAWLLCGKLFRFIRSFYSKLKCAASEFFYLITVKIRKNRPFYLISLCTVAMSLFAVSVSDFGIDVILDGKSLGYVRNEQEFEQIMRDVEHQASVYLGRPYILNLDVKYKLGFRGIGSRMETDEIKELMFSKISDIAVCYVLKIDGKTVAANGDKQAVESVLERIVNAYDRVYENSDLTIAQDISITEEPVSVSYLMDVDSIETLLTSPAASQVDYTVKKGDTLSALALKFGTSVDSITAINPEIQPNKLKIGQTLVTSKTAPMVTVRETAQIVYSESVGFETVTEKNDSMYTNERKVITKGKNGEKEVSVKVVCVNGEETERLVLSETVISEPVAQVEYVGTKKPPAKSPTGTFRRPYGGYISSNYGYRHLEFHTGVDFAGPLGSTIVASDGGTVTFAGNNGNYGKCVIISHGNNLQTLYAHCSSLLVKKGDKVAKGESIAKIGMTGRATGPHVHFEVRLNGKHVNPWNYIS